MTLSISTGTLGWKSLRCVVDELPVSARDGEESESNISDSISILCKVDCAKDWAHILRYRTDSGLEESSSSGCGTNVNIVDIASVIGVEGSKSMLILRSKPTRFWSLDLNDGRSNTRLDTGGGKTGKYGWMKT